MERKRKLKGGAQKLREKKKQLLASEAEKCTKLTDLFKVSATSGPSAVEQTATTNESEEYYSCSPASPSAVQQTAPTFEIEEDYSSNSAGPSEILQISKEVRQEKTASTSADWLTASYTVLEGRSEESESSSSDVELTTRRTETDLSRDSQHAEEVANIFARPKENERAFFFESHPVQPIDDDSLPFAAKKVFLRKNGSKRSWISYSKSSNALYCIVCLAYSKSNENSVFIDGMKDWMHTYQRINEHETSKHHTTCAEAHMQTLKHKDIGELLFSEQHQKRREEIKNNIQVMERVVEVIKMIGKRGLSYRGNKSEAAYALDDSLLDHGNFLELLILLSKYDPVLKRHLDKVVKKSQQAHRSGSKGRGSLLTFISKTTANNVIQVIACLIKKTIADEVREAGMYSVQLDTTQDISSRDQCSIIIRYVDKLKGIQERLLAIVNCTDSTGRGFLELLKGVLEANGLDIGHCIGNATDGAANMQGIYSGFSTWLTNESPGQVHVWCYSHILNLVISDATRSPIAATSLFSLLNGIAVFFKESYKRMDIWDQTSGQSDAGQHRRLQTIGETRWWSKDAALSKIFGSFGNPRSSMYVEVILALSAIEESENNNADLRAKARSYKEALLQYETIITAFVYLRIFKLTTPLSKYLQTVGIDLLKAHQMVMGTVDQLEQIQRDIKEIKFRVSDFIDWATGELEQCRSTQNIIIHTSFPPKRIRKRKSLPGEAASEETISDSFKDFEVGVHNRILDTTIESLKARFEKNAALYRDLTCLSPIQFGEIKTSLPHYALQKLSEVLVKFDVQITKEQLQSELLSLANTWERLKRSLPEEYILNSLEENVDDSDIILMENCEVGYNEKKSVCKRCNTCAVCVFMTLERYSLFSGAYPTIGLAYKYLLTLSTTQVACERSFSTLKFIKNRLRSTLSAEHLEAFLLMSVEKDLLQQIDSDTVINNLSLQSPLLRKELYLQ